MSHKNQQKLVSEYANQVFEPFNEMMDPYALTVKCPKCGCNEAHICHIKHESKSLEIAYVVIEFEGVCEHRWNLEFGSDGGEVHMDLSFFNKSYSLPTKDTEGSGALSK